VADESDDSFGTVQTTRTELGHLDLPAGKYVLLAKTTLNNNAGAVNGFNCDLTAGADSDRLGGGALNTGPQGGDDREVITLTVAHEFAAAGTVSFGCSAGDANANAGETVITAIKVENLTVTAFVGP
jgi:hypothetical protein